MTAESLPSGDSVVGSHSFARGPRRPREQAWRTLAVAIAAACAFFIAAVLAGTPDSVTTVVFAIVMIPVPFVAWLTYARAPRGLRQLWLLLAVASLLWFAGSVVWYAFYFTGSGELPSTPSTSDAIFAAARVTLVGAIVVAMRGLVSFRLALLDATVIAGAGIALGAVFVADGLRDAVDRPSLVLLYSPLLGTLTLMLIFSAAFGTAGSLPLSTALVGLGQALLTIGSMLYSHQAIAGGYVDARWPDVSYTAGAGVLYLAAAAILLRVDRPVNPFRVRIPKHPAASGPVLLLSLVALTVSLCVTARGVLEPSGPLTAIGLSCSVAIGAAMVLRAWDSIRTAEQAYGRLDHALAESERVRDELESTNEELARVNVELRTLQVAMADVLNLADARAAGKLRELIEETGGELAEILQEELERTRQDP